MENITKTEFVEIPNSNYMINRIGEVMKIYKNGNNEHKQKNLT